MNATFSLSLADNRRGSACARNGLVIKFAIARVEAALVEFDRK